MQHCDIFPLYPQFSLIDSKCISKAKDSDQHVEQLRREAIAQADRYAASERVQCAIGTTTLHKIIVVYRGMEMVVCEEI